MNIATVIGIFFGITILGFATYFSTDSVGVFINAPGLAIVLGGTLASTFICFPLKEVMPRQAGDRSGPGNAGTGP